MQKIQDVFHIALKQYIYIEEGNVSQFRLLKSDMNENLAKCNKVLEGKAQLFAVWPGQWRSDLFVIDDIEVLKNVIMN